MKNAILFIACSVLIVCSCSKEPEPEQRSRDSLSERLDIISQAREARQKQNEAVERRNKFFEEISKKHQGQAPAK